jgi:hypothetical protein
MSLPSNANMPNHVFPANAREYDAEFLRMVNQCMAFGEGIAPFDNTKDCTITGMGSNKATDLEVTTNNSGLQLSVALGNAWVKGDTRSTQGLYFCHVPTANVVTLEAAHGTHPRIDAVILQVADADAAGGSTNYSPTYAKGTATAGASLSNLTGAPTIPDSALLLAYVLVPATFAGPFVTATHVLDRRFFAYRPGRILGKLSAASDSVGAGDKLGPLTVVGDGIHNIELKSTGHAYSSGAAATTVHYTIRDAAAGAGNVVGKALYNSAGANYTYPFPCDGVVSALAGRASYYLYLANSSGTPAAIDSSAGTTRALVARYV